MELSDFLSALIMCAIRPRRRDVTRVSRRHRPTRVHHGHVRSVPVYRRVTLPIHVRGVVFRSERIKGNGQGRIIRGVIIVPASVSGLHSLLFRRLRRSFGRVNVLLFPTTA